MPGDLDRRAADLIREIIDLEKDALDGADARTQAAPLVDRFSTATVENFVASPPVLISTAWQEALKLYPSKDMKGNIDAIAKVALAYFGDVAIETLGKSQQEDFFRWMARLPKSHGKAAVRSERSETTARSAARGGEQPSKLQHRIRSNRRLSPFVCPLATKKYAACKR